MAFLRVQKLKRNGNGQVTSGSACLMRTVYDKDRTHKSRQEVVEPLGKVVWYDENEGKILCFSPTRGLVMYDEKEKCFKDVDPDDPRCASLADNEPDRSVDYGGMHLFLHFLNKYGFSKIFKEVFQKEGDFKRAICHQAHTFLRNGEKSSCDDFIENSTLAHWADGLTLSTLYSDCYYYDMMGREEIKKEFFTRYVDLMRKKNPSFGKCCYVDSTPLPNEIKDNPYNALYSHGTGEARMQTRLVLVLDQLTLMPVWFSTINGSVVDCTTVNDITNEVKEFLDITIDSYIFDAGYLTKEFIQEHFPYDEREGMSVEADKALTDEEKKKLASILKKTGFYEEGTVIGRMPAKKGYPHKSIYHKIKDKLNRGKYMFHAEGHTYFGIRMKTCFFNTSSYAYAYVDQENATNSFKNFLCDHWEEFEKLTDKDKDFKRIEGGYFILLSTVRDEPENILKEYFKRTAIESVFKTAKDALDIMPLAKWDAQKMKGKILSDIMSLLLYLPARKEANDAGLAMTRSISQLRSHKALFLSSNGHVRPEYPTKKVKNIYSKLKIKNTEEMSANDYFENFGL